MSKQESVQEKEQLIQLQAPFDTDGTLTINGETVKVKKGVAMVNESQLLMALTMGYKQKD